MKIATLFATLFLTLTLHKTAAQRFEAEDAVLTGGATVQSAASASGGKFVAQNAGALAFNISVETEGFYNITLQVAAPNGNKINVFSIGNNSINFSATVTTYTPIPVGSAIRLAAGNHAMKISNSWGYVNIDYLELQKVTGSGRFDINTTLVTPVPNEGAVRLYQFLYDNYGKKLISGVMTLNSFDETNWLKDNIGKEPALVGLDFMHSGRGYTWYNDKQPIEDARAYYNRNGIPAICWHWRDPLRVTEEFYTEKTSFDINQIFDEKSTGYKAMIEDIDYISSLLKELQDENIPVIWRPLHEAAGGWFWWGAKGPEGCKELWHVMFDRMVNHHGLKNLIWVWTREPNDDAWYPGDEYVDIVGRDIYKEGDHNSQILEFSDMNVRYGNKKMITISEVGSFPDPDKVVADGAAWSWFMPWYGDFVRDGNHNSAALWEKILGHEYVITLDEMPDLKTYEPAPPDPDPVMDVEIKKTSDVRIFPTRVEDSIRIETDGIIGSVIIKNILGQEVITTDLQSPSGSISMKGVKPGLYFIKVRNNPSVKVFKR